MMDISKLSLAKINMKSLFLVLQSPSLFYKNIFAPFSTNVTPAVRNLYLKFESNLSFEKQITKVDFINRGTLRSREGHQCFFLFFIG